MKNNFYEAIENRRSIYGLGNHEAVSEEKIVSLVNHMVKYCPSAFNSQSGRVVVLFKKNHQRLWEIVKETLQKIVPADKFAATEEKIASFAKGYATVLFLKIRMLWRICKGNFLCMPTVFLCGLCSRAVCCSIWFGRLWKMKEPVPVCSTIIL